MAGRGRPQSITYHSMAQDLLTDLDAADEVRRIWYRNPANQIAALSAGISEEQVNRVMSHSGVQSVWRSRVSAVDRLHANIVLTLNGRTERDHAVPLDAIRVYATEQKRCWIGTHEELVHRVAFVLERCLIKVKVSHVEHALLNMDYKFIMPPGHEDLEACDVLARYELVFPDRIAELRAQLTSR